MGSDISKLDKKRLLSLAVQQLRENLSILERTALEAKEAATHEESKAENEYDTRGLEAGYLAAGQAKRVSELKQKIYQMEHVKAEPMTTVGISALIHLKVDDSVDRFFLIAPVGGLELELDGIKVNTLTLDSPIGREIHEQAEGFDFSINEKDYEIINIS